MERTSFILKAFLNKCPYCPHFPVSDEEIGQSYIFQVSKEQELTVASKLLLLRFVIELLSIQQRHLRACCKLQTVTDALLHHSTSQKSLEIRFQRYYVVHGIH